jgi:hypothetical protein
LRRLASKAKKRNIARTTKWRRQGQFWEYDENSSPESEAERRFQSGCVTRATVTRGNFGIKLFYPKIRGMCWHQNLVQDEKTLDRKAKIFNQIG